MQKLLIYKAQTGIYVRSCSTMEEAAIKCKAPLSYIKRAIELNWAANDYYIIISKPGEKIPLKILSRIEREELKGKSVEAFNDKGAVYRFKSIGAASRAFNISRAAIFHVLESRQIKAAGLYWRRAEIPDNEQN